MKKTRIIVVRHPQTQANVLRVFQGVTDTELTDKGKIQVQLLSLRLRNVKIDYICSSPLKRAAECARQIAQYHNHEVVFSEELKEMNGGVWEGKPTEECREELRFHNMSPYFSPEGGESLFSVYERVSGFIDRLMKEHSGENILLVTHGHVIKCILARALSMNLNKVNEAKVPENSSVSYIDFYDNGKSDVVLLSDTSFLP